MQKLNGKIRKSNIRGYSAQFWNDHCARVATYEDKAEVH